MSKLAVWCMGVCQLRLWYVQSAVEASGGLCSRKLVLESLNRVVIFNMTFNLPSCKVQIVRHLDILNTE